MGKTSTASKRLYNDRVYRRIVANLARDLVDSWEEKLRKDGISKAAFIRNAINKYLEQS